MCALAGVVLLLAAAMASPAHAGASEPTFTAVLNHAEEFSPLAAGGEHEFNCGLIGLDPSCAEDGVEGSVYWGDGTSEAIKIRTSACEPTLFAEIVCNWSTSALHTYAAVGEYTGEIRRPPNVRWATFHVKVSPEELRISGAEGVHSGNHLTIEEPIGFSGNYCGAEAVVEWGDGENTVLRPVVPSIRRGSRGQVDGPDVSAAAEVTCFSYLTVEHTFVTPPTRNPVFVIRDPTCAAAEPQHCEARKEYPGFVTLELRNTSAIDVTETAATLEGEINPLGLGLSACEFSWRAQTEPAYSKHAQCEPAASDLALTGYQSVHADISGLSPGQTYSFRLSASNEAGPVLEEKTLTALATPPPGAPKAVTGAANNVTSTAATLSGVVEPNGGALESCDFEWGTDTSYGHATPCSPAPPSSGQVSATLSGLSPDTTYHYRIVAKNVGSARTFGADATFLTTPSCATVVTFGYVEAKGCFHKSAGNYISAEGTKVEVNGIELAADASTTSVTIEPTARKIRASANVKVEAGPVVLGDGPIGWTEPATNGIATITLAELTPPTGANVDGLTLEGKLPLQLKPSRNTELKGNVALPLGKLLGGLSINGVVTLQTEPNVGLRSDLIVAERKEAFELAGFEVKGLKVLFSPINDLWGGQAEVVLPVGTPKLGIHALLELEHGDFHLFEGGLTGVNAPIGLGVYLQKIGVAFGVDPTTVGGELGLTLGPADLQELVAAEGRFRYEAPNGREYGHFHFNGLVSIAGIKLASTSFDYWTDGLFEFYGGLELGLPETNSKEPRKQEVFLETSLALSAFEGKFDALSKAELDLNFIDTSLSGELLVSDKGIVGCGHVKFLFFSWSPGFGYTWADHEPHFLFRQCSIGPYETLPLETSATTSAVTERISLPGGDSLIDLTGTTGPPKVTLTGPGGRTVVVPANSVKPLLQKGLMVFQDQTHKQTYIAVQNGRGHWKATLEAGSSPIAAIRSAPILPAPQVKARVTRHGRRAVLSWAARPLPGQRIEFWEQGKSLDRQIASSAAGTGTVTFVPAPGASAQRTIVARVLSYGMPRAQLNVARYRGPVLTAPGRVSHVHAQISHGVAMLSWRGAAGAARYLVEVMPSDGAHLLAFTRPGTARLAVRDLVPIRGGKAEIIAIGPTGLHGAPAVTRFQITVKPHKHHRRHARAHAGR